MSTPREDQRTAVHLAALAALALAAVAPLAVTIVWLVNLDCPQTWHIVLGPVALLAVVWLIGAVLNSLGKDPKPGGRWDR